MNRKLLMVAAILLAMIFATSNHSVRAATRLQYKYVYCEDGETERTLNTLAEQGWELVGITRAEQHQHGYIFKKSE